jgi:2-polyprenyl-3-methyl-5-hydroxy-6-metoxy-1,4-benzoquinol methylase
MRIFCPLCKKESPRLFGTQDYNRRVSRETFYYYRCQSCKLIFLWPIPENLDDYYTKQYYSIPVSLEQLEARSEGERYKIKIVQSFVSSGRLLEIGPAYGSFTLLAKQAGFEVEAIEMDATCCKFLEEVVGVKAINSNDPSEALKTLEKYDVITLWHVIEHLPDPWRVVKMIAEKLLPGGTLVIAAPNPDAFQFHVLGRFWPHVDAPRHLELIPLSLLGEQMQSLGLSSLWTTTADQGTLGWNTFGWEVFFANISNLRFINRRLRKIGRAIGKVMRPVERMCGRGSAYTAVFRKEK